MFIGMSERNIKDRINDQRDKDKLEIEDWLHGSGGRIVGAIAILLALWAVAGMFWKF